MSEGSVVGRPDRSASLYEQVFGSERLDNDLEETELSLEFAFSRSGMG